MPETSPDGLPVFHVYGTHYPAGSRSGQRFSEMIPAEDIYAAMASVRARFPGDRWKRLSADFTGQYQQELFGEES